MIEKDFTNETLGNVVKEIDSLKMLLNSNGIPMAALDAAICFEEFKKNDNFKHVAILKIKADYESK